MKLPREFYLRDGLTVARSLVGKKLVTNLPEAVLIRALKPVDGVELMKIRRGRLKIF